MSNKKDEDLIKSIEKAAKEYYDEYGDVINNNGNHMAYGVSVEKNGKFCIAVRLTNKKNINKLPTEFKGYHVDIVVVGKIMPAKAKYL